MNPDTELLLDIIGFARASPWLHPIMSTYAGYGIMLLAAPPPVAVERRP